MWFALGFFEREYAKHMGSTKVGVVNSTDYKNQGAKDKPLSDVSVAKRVD
jgi:hypothetical protein